MMDEMSEKYTRAIALIGCDLVLLENLLAGFKNKKRKRRKEMKTQKYYLKTF